MDSRSMPRVPGHGPQTSNAGAGSRNPLRAVAEGGMVRFQSDLYVDPGTSSTRTMKEPDILRAELERLFERDELIQLSRDVLGFEPDQVGGTAAKASFAGALTAHCAENEAIEALCDALVATRSDVSTQVQTIRSVGLYSDT